ncbi:MAG: hypothetical protein ACJ72N_02035 [Labedaea sp.]
MYLITGQVLDGDTAHGGIAPIHNRPEQSRNRCAPLSGIIG